MPKTMNGAAELLLVTGDPLIDGETIGGVACLTVRDRDDRVRAIVRIADTLQAGGIAFLMAMLGNGIDGEVYAREIAQRIPFDRISQGTATDPRGRLVIVQHIHDVSTELEGEFRHIRVPDSQFSRPSGETPESLRIILETAEKIKNSITALPPES